MIPYGCLATGQNVGMIEVVRNAKTVMHILKQDIRSAMMVRTKELHNWIKEKNRSPSAVDRTAGTSEGYFTLGHSLLFLRLVLCLTKKRYHLIFTCIYLYCVMWETYCRTVCRIYNLWSRNSRIFREWVSCVKILVFFSVRYMKTVSYEPVICMLMSKAIWYLLHRLGSRQVAILAVRHSTTTA